MNKNYFILILGIIILSLSCQAQWYNVNSLNVLEEVESQSQSISNSTINIQELSTNSSYKLQEEDFLFELKKQKQYDLQEEMYNLINGLFILLKEIIIIVYYLFELWIVYKLFSDWIPTMIQKLAKGTANMFQRRGEK